MSISRKLKLVIMVTTSVALLLACAAFVAYDLISARRSMAGDLSSLAKVIGTNSAAALAFSDSDSTKDLLTGLSAKQSIAAAWISLDTGKVFAEYVRDRGFVPPDPGQKVYGSQFHRGYLIACEPIVLDSKVIGRVCLVSDLNALRDRIAQYCGVVAIVLFASLLVASLISSRLQRMISGPISRLARTARAISDEKDYTIRATKWGHAATIAHNGNDALALFDDEKFDCVLMDLQMPEINGFEATAVIRERERGTGEHIPIIALTAHALKGDRERCIEAGMDDYISKPIEAAKLFEIIEAVVNQSPIANETIRSVIKMFETDALINHYDGDVGLVVTLAAIFADSSTAQLSEIADAIARGDSTALAHSAHALRGSVANFHAQAAVDAAATLERMARSGELAMADSAFAVLKTEIQLLKEALETLEGVSVS